VVALSRRRFLGAAGALAGGVLLGGCGIGEATKVESDARVLERLLHYELAAVAALAGAPAAALAVRDQDRRHAARLARELVALGVTADSRPAPGGPTSLIARKQAGVYAYVEALPGISDPDLRVLVMQIAASEAEHLAVLRLAAGDEPVPDAFAGFTGAGGP
jgi:hypothetical protein